jgi:hypothetical protein
MIEFKDLPDLKRPDICRGIEHTEAYKDKKTRLKMIASEAGLLMAHKKKILRNELIPEIDNRLTKIMDTKIDELRKDLGSRLPEPQTRGPVSNLSSTISSILPQLGQKKVSAYEPEWRKLVRRATDSAVPTLDENVFNIENPMRARENTGSLTNIAITVETPTSPK